MDRFHENGKIFKSDETFMIVALKAEMRFPLSLSRCAIMGGAYRENALLMKGCNHETFSKPGL